MIHLIQTFEKLFLKDYFLLGSLVLLGIIIRFIFFPYNVPITLDGIDYFMYGIDLSRGNVLPEGYLINKFGWGVFLSPFFSLANNFELIELMNLQRVVSIIISTITVFPLYLIIKKFFEYKIALVSSALFIFNPKIIENSLLGISDPLFLFLIFSSIGMVITNKSKLQILGFFVAALGFFVRQEGIFLVFILIIILLINNYSKNKIFYNLNNKIRKNLLRILYGIIIFSLTLLLINYPINLQNEQISIFDPILDYFDLENIELNQNLEENKTQNIIQIGLTDGIITFVKFFIWILFPNLIVFFLISIIKINRNFSYKKLIVIIISLIFSFTPLMIYTRNFEDVRYIFPILLPTLIFSCISINFVYTKINNKKLILLLIIPIVISSSIFYQLTVDDYNYFYELSVASDFLINNSDGVNAFKDSRFIRSSELKYYWPELPEIGNNLRADWTFKRFSTDEYNNLETFVKENSEKGLTHILVKDKNSDIFFVDLLKNQNYPFLEKVFDSRDLNFKNKILIFKINKDKLN